MDHLTALRVFRQVVEQGGFAAASRQLGLSPAAVSKNIAELEAHVAARLLNRTTRRMSLTEAGTRYYEQVARILDELREAEQSLGPLQSAPTGTLRVSAPMSFTLTRLSAAIPAFLARHPDLSLDLNLEDRRVDIVKEGYDLAIRGTDRLEDSSLVARRLMTLEHVLCAAPAYLARHGEPASPADLRGHECVQFTLSGHADEWTFQRAGQTQRVPVRGATRSAPAGGARCPARRLRPEPGAARVCAGRSGERRVARRAGRLAAGADRHLRGVSVAPPHGGQGARLHRFPGRGTGPAGP